MCSVSSTSQACSNCGDVLTSEACDGCGYTTNPAVTGQCVHCKQDITENDVNIVWLKCDDEKLRKIHPMCLRDLAAAK